VIKSTPVGRIAAHAAIDILTLEAATKDFIEQHLVLSTRGGVFQQVSATSAGSTGARAEFRSTHSYNGVSLTHARLLPPPHKRAPRQQ